MEIETNNEDLAEAMELDTPLGVSVSYSERFTRSIDAPTIFFIALHLKTTVDIPALIEWVLAKIAAYPSAKATYKRKEINLDRNGLRIVFEEIIRDETEKTKISDPKQNDK